MTKAEAIERGRHLYQGKPCKKSGHSGLRYVTTGHCAECQRIKMLARYNESRRNGHAQIDA